MNTLPLNPEQQEIKSACGGVLQDPSKYPSAMFNGERVYFCNAACLNAFLGAPEAFMAGEIEHPLEDDEPTNS
jgi:YHS domain-containing protein